ncbi:MAG: efflux RND transporter periplasmic adaptor subunit [Phycisphaerae bacterium]|nr:efflux RND transporter periplasmic adaptor subunit [Phycisphaerae bacterium]
MTSTYLRCLALMAAMVGIWGCSKKTVPKEKPPPPAKVQNAVKETDLTTVTLTAPAESRLGIQIATVEHRSVERNRTFGGEVVSVSGRSVTISAPLSGTLLSPGDDIAVTAGGRVAQGQPLYRLLLALPEKDLLSVQEEVSLRKIEFELAETRAKRAKKLLDDKAGSVRDLEDAQAQMAGAGTSLETALRRLQLLLKGNLDSPADGLSSLTIKSPVDGIIQAVHVAPGQTVAASTALLEIAGVDPVWIKVPVYTGDMAVIDTDKPARIHSLADFAAADAQTAEPVAAPVGADPESATADLFYELSNADLSYRPGQKVGVTLALKDSEQNLVVPYSSILYDMYGSAWVYENTEPRVYIRRRVELRRALGELAILSRGPAVGAKVVSAGAAELFGTEFGVGK